MKTRKIVGYEYICERCHRTYSTEREAEACERSHYKFVPGALVTHHTGHYGTEQGDAQLSWYPLDKDGVVISADIDRCLVEFPDRSRTWCMNQTLDQRVGGDG